MSYKKIHKYAVEVIILLVVSYFVLRKSTAFSGSSFIKDVFQPQAGELIVSILTYVVIYALIAKVVIYTLDYFNSPDIPSLGLPHYRCILNNNKEIEKHIAELKNGTLALETIGDNHSYEENLQIIHRNFSEHLLNCLNDKKLGGGDIFLSIFHDKEFDLDFKNISKIHYSSHYDPIHHETSTETLDKYAHKDFAGIKALKKKTPVICFKVDKDYKVGEEERRQSIKHYIGTPLKINGCSVGLLNVEFHNKPAFNSAKEMKVFYQKEVQAFIYLYEYQLNKKYFFKHLNEKMVAA